MSICRKHSPNSRQWTPLTNLELYWNRDPKGTLMEIKGYKYILTINNYFAKWFEFIPLKTESGEEVGMAVSTLMIQYVCPDIIISYQGMNL